MPNPEFFVTGHKGFETPLFHELRGIVGECGAKLEKLYGGVGIDGGIEAAYRVCLYSRLANRIFCELARGPAADEEALYRLVYDIPWEQHLSARDSIAVDSSVSRSRLDHGQFVALKTKDAVVDRLRTLTGSRPVVDRQRPDIRIHVHLHRNQAVVSIDLSGESLHRRGYRQRHSGAPLKEHLAAALLVQAGWSADSPGELRLIDPMCGSGTFVIEAAMMAANIAPGLERDYFGFEKWRRHDAAIWQQCLAEARAAIREPSRLDIHASDRDLQALAIARQNAARAGVERYISFSHQQIADLELPATDIETLVCCNPPWGRRLDGDDLGQLYADLGDAVRRLAPARLAIFSANPELLHRLRLNRISRKPVRNGALECLFAVFSTAAEVAVDEPPQPRRTIDDVAAEPLRNRLRKNARHLGRWAARNRVSCYRIYDADLPEFAFALDRYGSDLATDKACYLLQEYQAPKTIDADKARQRILLAADLVREEFGIGEQQLFCKTRSRQRGREQYRKQDNRGEFLQVREGEAALLVNLSDYLDSGLFLDHRITRQRVYREAGGKRVLNLFCYTGTVGVQAGLGGARSVLNVDLSSTYLDWARENHLLNGLDDETRFGFLRADILELLRDPTRFSLDDKYDLIFFDPPSFSNSSSMRQTLDIQRDHDVLLRQAMRLLAPGGLLLFSTNRRGFRLDAAFERDYRPRDISRETLPEDFKRNPGIHRCWEIRQPDR
jgi:23S rRNA (guanine2445-N2)-methyltransferase / 23S rRNA (guanine2069-N7)-methyltransferase